MIQPIRYSTEVSLSDTNEIDPCRAIRVDVAGDVHVTFTNGQEDTFYVAAGMWDSNEIKQIHSTGTMATGIHAGY
jgi:hypothetical protein